MLAHGQGDDVARAVNDHVPDHRQVGGIPGHDRHLGQVGPGGAHGGNAARQVTAQAFEVVGAQDEFGPGGTPHAQDGAVGVLAVDGRGTGLVGGLQQGGTGVLRAHPGAALAGMADGHQHRQGGLGNGRHGGHGVAALGGRRIQAPFDPVGPLGRGLAGAFQQARHRWRGQGDDDPGHQRISISSAAG